MVCAAFNRRIIMLPDGLYMQAENVRRKDASVTKLADGAFGLLGQDHFHFIVRPWDDMH